MPDHTDNCILQKAISLANHYHALQTDKAGELYILHPIRVMLNVAPFVPAMIVAVLHDVLEDTSCTVEDLTNSGIPDELVYSICCLTKNKNEDYDEYLKKIIVNPLAIGVKLEDLKDNLNINRLSKLPTKVASKLAAKYFAAQNFVNQYQIEYLKIRYEYLGINQVCK